MDLQSMKMFVAAAEAGSLTDASRRLGVTPSGVSRAIHRLEEELGAALLVRSTRALRLTPEGCLLLTHAREILDDVEAAAEAVRNGNEAPIGSLRLSLPVLYGQRRVVPALSEFTRRYPAVRLKLEFTDRFVDPVEEGFDAVVRIGQLADSRLIARRLSGIRYAVVGSRSLLKRTGRPKRPQDLERYPCVFFCYPGTETPFPWRFQTDGEEWTHRPEGPLQVDSANALLEAALAGAGLAYIPEYVAAPHLESGRLTRLFDEAMPEPIPVSILFPESRPRPARLRALVDHLVDTLRPPHPADVA